MLWLVVAALAVRQMAVVLRQPPGERLTDLETWIGENGVLHVTGSLYDSDRFTGTPFAGLVLKPLTRTAEQSLGVAWTFGSLLLVAALGVVAARALPGPVARRTSLPAAPVAISLLMLSLPVRNTFHLGQTSILPVLLVLLACFAVRGERASGLLIGIAAALQPTVLLFAVLLWFTGRRRAAVTGGTAFAACTALAWAAMPSDSWTYWVHHVAGAGLGDNPDSLANQSLHGALLRFGLAGPLEIVLFVVLAAAVCYLGLRRAVRYARDGQLLLAVAVTGCVTVAVSPTAWQHQLLWVLLAVVGRVGKRASDRLVWPAVVVLVITLPGKMLLPNMAAVFPLRDNVLLIVALGAACAAPFLPRTSPYWQRPIPTDYADPVPSRWRRVPLLPFWRRVLSRPNLLLELLLIRVVYSAYAQVRLAATAGRATAEHHGRQIHSLEQWLHIDIEHWANHAVVEAGWLKAFFDYYYSTFHFIVPLAILGVLYVRRPADYRWVRSSIGFATLLALVGFWLYPLAPPRLMPGLGFIDTVHGVQDFAKPDYGALTEMTNQYAAMPSLHFGWSLWCGVVVVMLAPKPWMKALGLLHPLFTVSAIIATANHWVLDAVGGAAVVALGFGLTHVLSGPRKLWLPAVPTAEKPHDDLAVSVPVPRPTGDAVAGKQHQSQGL
ncbi:MULTISPECIES: bifunctional glycosyltransferase 87/phosphatase PAP2 family protein [unclassified Streptomyces]|uniref:bifunctional glycosyltransferase 87/phosphatase PAP2 family protein n=1 Tax=unclassified Streptomyces TaxID=2593676 RepID=UPI0022562DF2|nr:MULTISPECIES: bifunctional glycosyltransferase 87/phosphatase PAP2 family protein [unclassified Streptomyces]WSU26601.1 phosphatase PAP2 family protein [Streptomyces sp. NBC_01108]MCX4786419.1 phosphatase PAP2 family protein [Streptomyces sp. NBC_01221]MCX4797727.1 phosphatase PAP2 family protein [Streptomyces sp. NBC_01242]WSJ41197.1 phosphatase PAP2 family protein [Streptomyces sp. NBC_01321]WSP67527.1 phosphatase PAP2 family protein [Streptomyces sp. NBC_01240]